MATLMMKSEGQPVFHDFLGMSCSESATVLVKNTGFGAEIIVSEASIDASSGGYGGSEIPISVAGASTGVTAASSGLGSERQAGNNFEGGQLHGSKSDFSGPEITNKFSGKKRSNSDSSFMGSMRDRMLQLGTDALESSCLMKIVRNEVRDDRLERSPDDEFFFAMQPPRQTSNATIAVQPLMSGRTDLVVPKWDRSIPMNSGPATYYHSRFGSCGTYVDKVSTNTYADAGAGPSLIARPAADEGSRTGMKGSGIAKVITTASVGVEQNSSGMLPISCRPKAGLQNTEPESAKSSSQHIIASAGKQMTIFYAGQAHVFDDVQPKKADAIMAMAGSTGRSWSTTYSSKSSARASLGEAHVPSGDRETGGGNSVFSQDLRNRLPIMANANHGFLRVGRVLSLDDPNLSSEMTDSRSREAEPQQAEVQQSAWQDKLPQGESAHAAEHPPNLWKTGASLPQQQTAEEQHITSLCL